MPKATRERASVRNSPITSSRTSQPHRTTSNPDTTSQLPTPVDDEGASGDRETADDRDIISDSETSGDRETPGERKNPGDGDLSSAPEATDPVVETECPLAPSAIPATARLAVESQEAPAPSDAQDNTAAGGTQALAGALGVTRIPSRDELAQLLLLRPSPLTPIRVMWANMKAIDASEHFTERALKQYTNMQYQYDWLDYMNRAEDQLREFNLMLHGVRAPTPFPPLEPPPYPDLHPPTDMSAADEAAYRKVAAEFLASGWYNVTPTRALVPPDQVADHPTFRRCHPEQVAKINDFLFRQAEFGRWLS